MISFHILRGIHIIYMTLIEYLFGDYGLIPKRRFLLFARYWYVFWITAIIIRATMPAIIYSFVFFIVYLFTRFILHLLISGRNSTATAHLTGWLWSLVVIVILCTWLYGRFGFLRYRFFNFIAILWLYAIFVANHCLLRFN